MFPSEGDMRSKQILLVGFLVASTALTISRRLAAEEDAKPKTVTFNKEVLPILQNHCQTCHRPGEIAPMSFITYKDTRPWAKAMKTAVLTRQMPPWFADPGYGHFVNDKRLSDSDIQTIAAWADGGA